MLERRFLGKGYGKKSQVNNLAFSLSISRLIKLHEDWLWKVSKNVFKHCWTTASRTSIAKNFYVCLIEKRNHKKNCLWWRVVVSCISHASGTVLKRIFLKKLFFKHIKMAASEFTKKRPFIFNTIAGCKTPSYILLWNFIRLFMRIITIFSAHFLSLLQSSFLQEVKRKCSSISVKRSMLILIYVTGTYFSRSRKRYF